VVRALVLIGMLTGDMNEQMVGQFSGLKLDWALTDPDDVVRVNALVVLSNITAKIMLDVA
jgi:hypothetical protein